MGNCCSTQQRRIPAHGTKQSTALHPSTRSTSAPRETQGIPSVEAPDQTPSIITPEMWARDYADRTIRRAFSSTSSNSHRSQLSSPRYHRREEEEDEEDGMQMKSFETPLSTQEQLSMPLSHRSQSIRNTLQNHHEEVAGSSAVQLTRETFNPLSCANYEAMLQQARVMATEQEK